jgi:hypothetical protein
LLDLGVGNDPGLSLHCVADDNPEREHDDCKKVLAVLAHGLLLSTCPRHLESADGGDALGRMTDASLWLARRHVRQVTHGVDKSGVGRRRLNKRFLRRAWRFGPAGLRPYVEFTAEVRVKLSTPMSIFAATTSLLDTPSANLLNVGPPAAL